MNRLMMLAAATAMTATATLWLVPSTSAQMNHDTMHIGEMSGASTAYVEAMKKMDMGAMTMTGKPGADFALMMIPHHQSAIDMARAYLESGDNDPELTRLSHDIIAAQESEIAFLKGWLATNGQ